MLAKSILNGQNLFNVFVVLKLYLLKKNMIITYVKWSLFTVFFIIMLFTFQRFVCFECTPIRNMCTELRLYNHRAKFHRGQQSGFKCKFCNLKFLTPRKLRKHTKMSHVFTKTYACHFCDELFTSETSVEFGIYFINYFKVHFRSQLTKEFTQG